MRQEKALKWHQKIPLRHRVLLGVAAFVWLLEIIDLMPGLNLDAYGVRPREFSGLIGIPLKPFLHGGFAHLLANTTPFLVLGWIVLEVERKNFIFATIAIIFLGGFGSWLIGRPNTNHIGASGLVYGYFGYVIVRAFLEKKIVWILTGVVVAFLYGGMIYGVLPNNNHPVSWEGHLCGMLAGGWFGRRRTKQQKFLESQPRNVAEQPVSESRRGDHQPAVNPGPTSNT